LPLTTPRRESSHSFPILEDTAEFEDE